MKRTRTQRRRERERLDEAGVPVCGPHADVIFELTAESTDGAGAKVSVHGRAPASSPLGRALATIPLGFTGGLYPFAMGAAAYLFIGVPWMTATAILLGFAGGIWCTHYQMRTRTRQVTPTIPPARAALEQSVLPPALPPAPTAVPEPEQDTASPKSTS